MLLKKAHFCTKLAFLALLPLQLTLGCHGDPNGQVVAVVNGEEVSLSEVNLELRLRQLGPRANWPNERRAALQEIIDRKLIAAKARAAGIDQTPAFVQRKRKLNDDLLISLLGQTIAPTVPMPDRQAIELYKDSQPTRFQGRQRLTLDQIQFTPPRDIRKLAALQKAHDIEAVAATLRAQHIVYTRGTALLDTGDIDPPTMAKINALPPHEPFTLPSPNGFVAAVIVARAPLATLPDSASQVALAEVRALDLTKESAAQVALARSKATIRYQDGFAPVRSNKAP
jgi:EpsD family peptidyl-prolyl cis-trans isomerase